MKSKSFFCLVFSMFFFGIYVNASFDAPIVTPDEAFAPCGYDHVLRAPFDRSRYSALMARIELGLTPSHFSLKKSPEGIINAWMDDVESSRNAVTHFVDDAAFGQYVAADEAVQDPAGNMPHSVYVKPVVDEEVLALYKEADSAEKRRHFKEYSVPAALPAVLPVVLAEAPSPEQNRSLCCFGAILAWFKK